MPKMTLGDSVQLDIFSNDIKCSRKKKVKMNLKWTCSKYKQPFPPLTRNVQGNSNMQTLFSQPKDITKCSGGTTQSTPVWISRFGCGESKKRDPIILMSFIWRKKKYHWMHQEGHYLPFLMMHSFFFLIGSEMAKILYLSFLSLGFVQSTQVIGPALSEHSL